MPPHNPYPRTNVVEFSCTFRNLGVQILCGPPDGYAGKWVDFGIMPPKVTAKWSQRPRPRSPDRFSTPEFSRILTDSIVEAARTVTRLVTSNSCRDCRSI